MISILLGVRIIIVPWCREREDWSGSIEIKEGSNKVRISTGRW